MKIETVKVGPPRRSHVVVGACVAAVLLVLFGFGCLIWAKNAGRPITSAEPYRWDGRSTIMIVYHDDYESGDDTCVLSARTGDQPDVQFRQWRDSSNWFRVHGETLEEDSYGYDSVITCADGGNRVLTGPGAVLARYWGIGPVVAVFVLLGGLVVYVRGAKSVYMRRLLQP